VAALLALTVATVGAAIAQNVLPKGNAGGRPNGKAARRNAAKGNGAKKARPNAADPLENIGGPDPLDKGDPAGAIHYRLKLRARDGVLLTVVYFPAQPARLSTSAPVILMVHEKDRSSRDFEEPIADLKGQGLAEHLQSLGYAVLAMNLRGQGANERRALTPRDWTTMIDDLQCAYQFLVDRHNRGKLNLSKLGVLALGEGANLAAAWANTPGGAVSSEGRTSDLGAMVLISPMADGEGFLLREVTSSLAPRIPLMLMVGERDPVSADPVRTVRPTVERPAAGLKLNRVEMFDSSLHGYKLLWLEPRVTSLIAKFFEGTVKLKASAEWEPRYNLTPVHYGDIQLVRSIRPANAAAKKAAPAEAKEKEQEKEKAADKAKEQEQEKKKENAKAQDVDPPARKGAPEPR
jgi:hypothetical protein